jgi:TATA-box binding protein (TBP) (component of TFIID and TFIIIB)
MELIPLQAFEASEYRVSTMTITGSINTCVNLSKLFDTLDITNYTNIEYVEYGTNKHQHEQKGQKEIKNKNRKAPKKRFDNQLTIHMYDDKFKYNIKLFKNGNVQMTGVKDIEGGRQIIDELIKIIRITNKISNDIVEDEAILKNCNYAVRLMNSDFKINYKINRSRVHMTLVDDFKLTCSYEPCIYQGVKLSFFVNDYSKDGICKCEKKCLGKGKNTICKKITVALFQSGCVTITGATSKMQMDFVYEYIKEFLILNMQTIHQPKYQLI